MRAGSFQVRLLGVLVIGVACSIIACSGGPSAVVAVPPNNPTPTTDGSTSGTTPSGTQGLIRTLSPSYLATSTSGATLTLSPSSCSLSTNGTLVFTTALTGMANTTVTWAVDMIPGGNAEIGTITGSGSSATYHAPASVGSHLVTATSAADSTLMVWSAVTLQDLCPPLPAAPTTTSVRDAAYGAAGDGVANDTAAIQKAINHVAGTGGTVLIPDGTYLITTNGSGNRGLQLKSQMSLKMSAKAVLKAIPNSSSNYTILSVDNATNVNIAGGTLEGDRAGHTGTSGEYGHGLQITSSQQVVVSGVTARECWGDGFYISQCSDVTLCSIVADHNRRNGLSVTGCDGLMVRNSVFMNTQGTEPEDGFDIEPNPGQRVNNIQITGCIFFNNSGNGMEDGVPDSNRGTAFITNLAMDGNSMVNNGAHPADGAIKNGIRISGASYHQVTHNLIIGNTGRGLYIREYADNTLATGNIIMNTTGDGVVLDNVSGVMVTNNTVINNTGHGISTIQATGGTTGSNTVQGNRKTP